MRSTNWRDRIKLKDFLILRWINTLYGKPQNRTWFVNTEQLTLVFNAHDGKSHRLYVRSFVLVVFIHGLIEFSSHSRHFIFFHNQKPRLFMVAVNHSLVLHICYRQTAGENRTRDHSIAFYTYMYKIDGV